MAVLPGSPASVAGIAAGDTIDSIDGRPARTLGNADIYALMRQPVGTVVTIVVVHNSSKRTTALTLRDIPLPKK